MLDLRIAREEHQIAVLEEVARFLGGFVGINYFLGGWALHQRDVSFPLEVERKAEQQRTSAQDRLGQLRRQMERLEREFGSSLTVQLVGVDPIAT